MRIEALIFDIGNVLVPFDWQPFQRQLQADVYKPDDRGRKGIQGTDDPV